MLYNVNFDIAAIMLNAMLLLIVYVRRTFPTRTCTLYKWMLWFNLISSCTDLFSAFTISFPTEYPLILNYIVCLLYLLSHNLSSVLFLMYAIVLIRGNYGKRAEKILCGVIAVYDTVVILTSPLTGWIIYFDDALTYCHGPLLITLYIGTGIMLGYSMLLFIRHHNMLNHYQIVVYTTFLALVMGAVAFQAFFGRVLIESFCAAIAFLMMNVALDNPAIYFYRNTTCFNNVAFNYTMERALEKDDPFVVLAFTFDDLVLFRKIYGNELQERLLSHTIRLLHRTCGGQNVYLLPNEVFALTVDKEDLEKTEDAIRAAFRDPIELDDRMLVFKPHFCVFRHPGFAEGVEDVTDAIHGMLTDIYNESNQEIITIDGTMMEKYHRQARIVHYLRDAIRGDGFDIYYQPIRDNRSGGFPCAEALVRLRPQDGEFIGPDEFIPLAEKNGMILEIGEMVMEKVCRFFRDAKLTELGIRYLEVNLSMLQLLEPATPRRLMDICKKYGIEPSTINFEITETAGVSESEHAMLQANIAELITAGFTFSLDDYGSGYATASYFAEMPFHIVKIDKNILWNAMEKPGFRAVLENSIQLVHAFDRECVVEGVETEEMVRILTDLGCDLFQGYLYSRPIPEGEFVKFLTK